MSAISVVPRLVEAKAAPAAKDSSGAYPYPPVKSAKDKAIGRMIPMAAQSSERKALEKRRERLVDKPPEMRGEISEPRSNL